VLHLVGYDHGDEMDAREALHLSRRLDGGDQGAQAPALPAPERE
jgi:hypothetical protein